MHKLANIILGNELADACIMNDGSLALGNFDQIQENEVDWLAGTLLLPRPALMSIRSKGILDHIACGQDMVSKDMLIWRARMMDMDRQLTLGSK